ncbi:MAG TPA: SDR family oxidoreductase [Candidatus Thermoplasmatota archaeon]|nr:SDR family oxidoreductase [Candidatus Thermoplasmatota archaeon]
MSRPLAGRTAIVTGSTGEGMGRQTAWTLAREGANVVLNYGTYRRSDAAARRAVKECEALGGQAIAVRADTRKEAEVKRLVRQAEQAFGRVDIAVANAGGDFLERSLESLSLAEWKRVVDAEVDGAFLLARETLPGMRRRGWGRLVFLSWDKAATYPVPPYDYAVGKVARETLAHKLARLGEGKGITSNVVAPGYIPYPSLTEARQVVRHGPAWTKRKRSGIQDVAEAVAWLCTEEARFVTGATLRVWGPR